MKDPPTMTPNAVKKGSSNPFMTSLYTASPPAT